MTLPIFPHSTTARSQTLHGNLREAQDEHDIIRRALCDGVTAVALASDNRRWEAVGASIAGLAALIRDHCAASAFVSSRPDIAELTGRLSEAIDDMLDEPAWTVIDAAARLTAADR